ncbi:MAG TPA: hypothetical protein VNV63_06015, partial [Nitrospiria bacterium]|nr:hypothetical protein [Nitrospiria bacterium]
EIVPCRLAQPWWLVIVNPGFQVSTAWAYQQLAAERKESKTGLTNSPERTRMSSLNSVPDIRRTGGRKGRRIVVKEVLGRLDNSLESVTGAHYPVILDIKAQLLAAGAQGALMSGSGPTVFGLFSNRSIAKAAADRFKSHPGWRIWIVKTLQRLPKR